MRWHKRDGVIAVWHLKKNRCMSEWECHNDRERWCTWDGTREMVFGAWKKIGVCQHESGHNDRKMAHMRWHKRDGAIAVWCLKKIGVCQDESSHNDRERWCTWDGTRKMALLLFGTWKKIGVCQHESTTMIEYLWEMVHMRWHKRQHENTHKRWYYCYLALENKRCVSAWEQPQW